eukprot:GEMP01004855.1.p1 GENE.GEMP01004855.1~~GEMP01004855.1.p1  ORF type:complete len:864 (+),score=115.11 GEMP01004855.1:143-2734(+)
MLFVLLLFIHRSDAAGNVLGIIGSIGSGLSGVGGGGGGGGSPATTTSTKRVPGPRPPIRKNPAVQRAPPAAPAVVTTESKCIKEFGDPITDQSKHPATKPTLPRIGESAVIPLTRASWPRSGGTFGRALRITRPGKYRLEENITFDFKETPSNAAPPLQWDNVIGIAIESSGVELDLNGKTLSMTKRFARRQRFFFIIQLNNAVFPKGTAFYDQDLVKPNNIVIKNGKFGRTTHMAIQGFENGNVLFENLQFENFEVAAISCVDCNHVTIRKCNIDNNVVDVPFNNFFADFWATTRLMARFINSFGPLDRDTKVVSDLNNAASKSVFAGNSNLIALSGGKPQGSIFGIQLKTSKTSQAAVQSTHVLIENVLVKNIANAGASRIGFTWHGVQLICDTSNLLDYTHYFQPSGLPKPAVFRPDSRSDPRITLFRICVLSTVAIPQRLKDFVENVERANIFTIPMEDGAVLKKFYGSDIRGHEPNGVHGIRVRGMKGVTIRDVTVEGIANGETGIDLVDRGQLQMTEDPRFEKFPNLWQGEANVHFVQHLANAYGVCLDNVVDAKIRNVKIKNVHSRVGQSFGVAIGRKSSTIWLDKVAVLNIIASPPSVRGIPFLTPRPMNIYIEENTQSFAYRNVFPAHGWLSPTTPTPGKDYSKFQAPRVGACGDCKSKDDCKQNAAAPLCHVGILQCVAKLPSKTESGSSTGATGSSTGGSGPGNGGGSTGPSGEKSSKAGGACSWTDGDTCPGSSTCSIDDVCVHSDGALALTDGDDDDDEDGDNMLPTIGIIGVAVVILSGVSFAIYSSKKKTKLDHVTQSHAPNRSSGHHHHGGNHSGKHRSSHSGHRSGSHSGHRSVSNSGRSHRSRRE